MLGEFLSKPKDRKTLRVILGVVVVFLIAGVLLLLQN
jgi:hypothetical protein